MGVMLIGFGIYALVALEQFMSMTGFTMNGVLGHSEARAIYLGSMIAMGALTLYAVQDAAARSGMRSGILLSVGITFLGFVVGRIVSMIMDGYDPAVVPAIAFEFVTTIVLLTAAFSRKRSVEVAADAHAMKSI
jgi:hypothetical protein